MILRRKSFTSAEQNYSQIQREAAALVFTVKKFHKYLNGRKFVLHTDHKSLLSIFGSKDGIPVYTASRLKRYALTLLTYEFDIEYIDTESFGYADMVSRLIYKHPRENEETVIAAIKFSGAENETCFAFDAARMLPVKFIDIQEATRRCKTLQEVTEYVKNGWPQKKQQIRNDKVKEFFVQRNDLDIIQGCLFKQDRIVIPTQYRNQILEELHNGNPGIVRMKLLARNIIYWPTITQDIERKVKSCEECARVPIAQIKCTLQSWPHASKAWSRIHIDYAGPLDGCWYLVIVDAYSNWPEIFKTALTTSKRTIELIEEAFSRNGLCDTIVSDNGPQFSSLEFKNVCIKQGIQHCRTAPYHPQSNGKAEKFVHILKTAIAKT